MAVLLIDATVSYRLHAAYIAAAALRALDCLIYGCMHLTCVPYGSHAAHAAPHALHCLTYGRAHLTCVPDGSHAAYAAPHAMHG